MYLKNSFRRACARHVLFAICVTLSPIAAIGDNDESVVVQGSRLSVDGATTTLHEDDASPITEQSFARVTERVANLQVNSGGAGSYGDLLTMRGLSNTPYFSDPAVTVYLDDIPLGNGFAYPNGLFGFFDAAIRRGPQGTTVGRAGQGGVMLLSSGDLSLDAPPSLTASVGAGKFDARTASLTARVTGDEPLTGVFAASYAARDGFIRNTLRDERVDDQDSVTVATRARWRPNDDAEFTLQLLGNRQRNGAQPLIPLDGPYFTVEREFEGQTDIDFFGAAIKGDLETRVGRLTSVTSHTQWQLDPYRNHVVLPPALDADVRQSQRAWNEELRLTAESDRSHYMLGAWFSDAATEGDVNRSLTGLFPIEASKFELGSRTVAIFGEWSAQLNADWQITAGLRAERTQREFDRDEMVPLEQRYRDERDFDALMPKLGVRYSVSATTHVTATLARSAKPGGWSAYTGDEVLAGFDQETTNSFELAITSDISTVASLAARAFVYDIRDYQIERSFTLSDYLVVNAPRARSLGAEIEGQWRPTNEFGVTGSVGMTRATLREFTDPFSGVTYGGNRAPYAPAYDANISAAYQHGAGWFVSAEVSAVGRTYYDEAQTNAFSQASRTTAAARLGFRAEHWRVTLFGENLSDERYYTMIVPGVAHGVPGAPRTWGIELATSMR